jgi:hypothetical protein
VKLTDRFKTAVAPDLRILKFPFQPENCYSAKTHLVAMNGTARVTREMKSQNLSQEKRGNLSEVPPKTKKKLINAKTNLLYAVQENLACLSSLGSSVLLT